MANPVTIPITATGTFAHYPDWLETPFDISYAIELASGTTGTYTVSYSMDDPNDATWTPVWIADPTNGSAQTTSQAGYFDNHRIRGIRVIFSALGGTASARFVILQGMSSR